MGAVVNPTQSFASPEFTILRIRLNLQIIDIEFYSIPIRKKTKTRKMSSLSADQKQALDTQAVNNFREYLQIPSVHPDVNYDACVKFLEKQAKSLGLPIKIVTITTGKPIVILSWIGEEPELPTILLNSHMDVVPVFEEKWTYGPFSAHVDDKENIYARGTQDMKSVGIQYLEAVRRLKQQGIKLRRTVHISFVPGI
ncbi:hypothetical protein NQ318_018475 [Aromia moschata]|uniref:Aminoacylase-1 n=1 Tax=Aromia moschata TaxID=1265417 RepID=A0AAV8YMM8_9CUCU|nr:hypothetical protein NQ318_018475 [Aromia moschata]